MSATMPADATRVAVVSSVHRWNDTRVYLKQAQSLAAAGFDTLLVAIDSSAREFTAGPLRVRTLARRKRLLRFLTWIEIVRLVFRHRARIVHAHDPELFPVVALLRLAGKRVVCDVHEDLAEQILHKEWIAGWLRRPLSALARGLYRVLPRISNGVVLAEDSYFHLFPTRPNVRLVRNFPFLPEEHRRDYDTSLLRLVYVGDVRIVRGIRHYVQILDALRQRGIAAELRVIGSFAAPAEEQEIRALIDRLGLAAQVRLLGRRPPEEVPGLLADCDVGLTLLHPIGNYRESYPTKMFEYMAAGIPVVSSNFPLWEAVVIPNDCGVAVDPLDVAASADAVERYARSPELRRHHGTNGRRAVADKYQWAVEFAELRSLYAQLV
jgi:glycosyltransferase involved in cell wall biosynthesis